MEQIEIAGYKRGKLNYSGLKKLREEALVPGVLYGEKINKMFSVPAFLLKNIVYSSIPKLIKFNIEGDVFNCILKEVQFHPVSEVILHVDFKKKKKNKKIQIVVPILIQGANIALGVKKGGLLIQNLKKATVLGLYEDIPNVINVDVANLDAGETLRITDILNKNEKYKILANPKAPIVGIKASREKTDSKV